MLAYVVRKRCMTRAPFSPWSRRRVRQHVERNPPWPAPRCRLALRLAVPRDARCVGPTSAILTSTYEYPCLVGSRCVRTLSRLAQSGKYLPVSTTVQFASAGRTSFPRNCHRGGRCLPVAMRADRASDIPVASPAFPMTLARSWAPPGPPRPPSTRPRERTSRWTTWDAFRLTKTFAPQRPLERPARAFPGSAAWPPRCWLSTPLHSPEPPCGDRESWVPVHALRSQRKTRFFEPRRRSPTSATEYDARAHPTSHRSSHASEAFAPLHAGTNRCQLRWPPPMRCRTVGLRAATHTRRLSHVAFRLRGEVGHGSEHSSEGEPRALDDVARALLVVYRAPGSPVRFFVGSGWPGASSPRPRSSLDASPRRAAPSKGSRCLWLRRNPYASRGLLPGARLDRGPVTPPR